ncbi:MAG: PilZ domain-containing protein [Bryobacterales bacterium]|nr:PilZ domain-containing protein [Bryobacterales bacterium]
MKERRSETRLLCADLVEVEWKDKTGRRRRSVANLEDISKSGACLQLDLAIPLKTPVRIRYERGDLDGMVRYCVYREIGYFLGIEFEPGQKWNERTFRPLHLFDPRRLTQQSENS